MSILIEQPAMALNAVDAPGAHYKMYNSWEIPATENLDHILDWTATVASGAPGGYLKALIINCHGYYNGSSRSSQGGFGLALGTGIRRADTPKFSKLKGKVSTIWITACGTARITVPGTSSDGDGNLFCQEIARHSGAYVIAATTMQFHDLFISQNRIDDFEGLVLRYNPSGIVDWSGNYGQGILDGLRWGWN
jgi:hypothetical protein